MNRMLVIAHALVLTLSLTACSATTGNGTSNDDEENPASTPAYMPGGQRAGYLSGRLDPQGSVTRSEASAILHRFAENVAKGRQGWVQNDAGQWQYINTEGQAVTGWLTTPEGNKYWFDENGFQVCGKWVQIEDKWYYFDEDGKLAVNATIDGYEVGADGAWK